MKLSQSKTLTGVLLALFFAASCEELPEMPTNVNLGVTPKEVTIPAEGGTAKVSFNAPVSWEATTSVDWLSISPASGESGNDVTITLVAKANGSTDRRTASVTVTVVVAEKKFTESVNVIQEGATPPEPDPSLEVSVDGFKFNAEGGDGSFNIVSNLPWSAKVSADWLSLTQYSGDAGTATVIVTGARNETIEARRGTVTVTAGNLQKTVTVSQEGASAWISVSSQKEEAPADGATISLTVSSNAQWSASASSGWLSVNPASGTDGTVATITVSANTSVQERTGTVTFTAGNASATVTVVQAGITPIITLAYTTLTAPAAGGSHTLTLKSNAPWQASSGASWLVLSPSNGDAGDFTITLAVEANTSSDPRTVSVNFSASGASATLTVTQEGKKPDGAGFDGSVNDWEEGGDLEFNETTII